MATKYPTVNRLTPSAMTNTEKARHNNSAFFDSVRNGTPIKTSESKKTSGTKTGGNKTTGKNTSAAAAVAAGNTGSYASNFVQGVRAGRPSKTPSTYANYSPATFAATRTGAAPTSGAINALGTNTAAAATAAQNGVPIRSFLRGKGVNDKDIGYDGTNVTINGRTFIAPKENANGTTYGELDALSSAYDTFLSSTPPPVQNAIDTSMYPTKIASAAEVSVREPSKDVVPVRSSMINSGLNNNLVGWNNGNVQYGGSEFIKPEYVKDGVSYASQAAIDNAVSNFKTRPGVVDVTSYTSSIGLPPGSIEYMGGSNAVSVMGVPVQIQYIENGNAVVKQSDIDAVVENYMDTTPNMLRLYKDVTDRQETRLDRALKKYENADAWEYSPEDDPAYQAYLDAAMRNGNTTYDDTLARLSAMSGGFANSNALAVAAQAKDAYMKSLNEQIPQLMSDSYTRYGTDRNRELEYLDRLRESMNDVTTQKYNITAALQEAMKNSGEFNYKKGVEDRAYNLDNRKLNSDIAVSEGTLGLQKETLDKQDEWHDEELALSRAQAGLPDPTAPTAKDPYFVKQAISDAQKIGFVSDALGDEVGKEFVGMRWEDFLQTGIGKSIATQYPEETNAKNYDIQAAYTESQNTGVISESLANQLGNPKLANMNLRFVLANWQDYGLDEATIKKLEDLGGGNVYGNQWQR